LLLFLSHAALVADKNTFSISFWKCTYHVVLRVMEILGEQVSNVEIYYHQYRVYEQLEVATRVHAIDVVVAAAAAPQASAGVSVTSV